MLELHSQITSALSYSKENRVMNTILSFIVIVAALFVMAILGWLVRLAIPVITFIVKGVLALLAVVVFGMYLKDEYSRVQNNPSDPKYYGTVWTIIVPECKEYWDTHTVEENYNEYGRLH